MREPALTVVIVNWNTHPLLARCVESVYRTVQPAPEVIVVDNASTDDSVAFLRNNYPAVHIIENTANVGFAAGNNQALTRCQGEQALLLNSDAELLPGAVARLQAALAQDPRAATAGPMLITPDGAFQAGPNDEVTLWSETLVALGLNRFLRQGYYPGYPGEARSGSYAWVGGTCLLISRAAWRDVGLLDPAFFMYVEEADWCWRARLRGWHVLYVAEAQVVHVGGASSRQVSSAMRAELYKSKLLFFIKHRPRWQAAVLRSVLMVNAVLKASLYGAAGWARPRIPAYRERAASFRLVYRAVKSTG